MLFMPIMEEVVARVAACSREKLRHDPMLGAGAIEQAAGLLEADLIALGFDYTLTLEACGVDLVWEQDQPKVCGPGTEIPSNLMGSRLERFTAMLDGVLQAPGRRKPVAVALCGPATLIRHLCGEAPSKERLNEIKPLLTKLAEAVCSRRPDLLVLQEQADALELPPSADLRRAYGTLRNVAAYYGTGTALYLEGETNVIQCAAKLAVLKMDVLMLERLADWGRGTLAALLSAAGDWSAIGLPVPVENPAAVSEMVSMVRELACPGTTTDIFFLSEGVIPREADLEQLRTIKTILQRQFGWNGSQEAR